MADKHSKPLKNQRTIKNARQARLAAELRSNLQKRKARLRAIERAVSGGKGMEEKG